MEVIRIKGMRQKLVDNWKSELGNTLKSLGLVGGAYTGKIILNFNEGSISVVERQERLK